MHLLKVTGGTELSGTISVSGSKNSALGIIVSAIMFNGIISIKNVPNILDIRRLLEIFKDLSILYTFDKNELCIYSHDILKTDVLNENVKMFRASYYFMGALLGRYKNVKISYPGGCKIGSRPIDYHMMGFEALGATISYYEDYILLSQTELVGTEILLPKKSVGATVNIILASLYAKGETVIKNASIEPEVIDIISFLSQGGFNIFVIDDEIRIEGRKEVIEKSFDYYVMPDRIEAGTYLALGLVKGPLLIKNADYKSLKEVIYTLMKADAIIEIHDSDLLVYPSKIRRMNIITEPYPGFPTDLEQVFAPILSLYGGSITEEIFENRLGNCFELKKMGALVNIEGQKATFEPSTLTGCLIEGLDLRGATSLLIAGLIADGITYIKGYEYIERGYEDIIEKLMNIGARIEIVSC